MFGCGCFTSLIEPDIGEPTQTEVSTSALAAVTLIDDQDAKSEHQWRYLPGVVPYRRLKDR